MEIQLVVKTKTSNFYEKSSFLKIIGDALRLSQNILKPFSTSVHYEAVSHTGNQNLEFIRRSKKLLNITKNRSQNSTKFSKQCHKSSFKQIVCFNLLMVHLLLQRRFLSVLKGISYSHDTKN